MQNRKVKIAVVSIFFLLGVLFFSYGTFLHSAEINAGAEGGSEKISKSERTLVKDVSVGGVVRDESGKIKQTYEKGEKPPETCST